jgi:hypothetical protein
VWVWAGFMLNFVQQPAYDDLSPAGLKSSEAELMQ